MVGCLLSARAGARQGEEAAERLAALFEEDAPRTVVPADLFARLGVALPDGGVEMKRRAQRAPGGALDPNELATLPAGLGYRAKWHAVRWTRYGLAWDVTGVALEPDEPERGLPTLVLVAPAWQNWYGLLFDPSNNPGLAQYLAQKVRVLVVGLPGTYRPGGFREGIDRRRLAYRIDGDVGGDEARARNALATFALATEGIVRLVEQATRGRLLVVGLGTSVDAAFLLRSPLAERIEPVLLGWGGSPPAALRRLVGPPVEAEEEDPTELRRFDARRLARFVGPWHPLAPPDLDPRAWRQAVEADPALAERLAADYLRAEAGRQPFVEPVLLAWEHEGRTELRERAIGSIRAASVRFGVPPRPDEAMATLFATVRAPLGGFRRIVWICGGADRACLPPPGEAGGLAELVRELGRRSPGAATRAVVVDGPLGPLGPIERPRELAGLLLAAARWLSGGEPR